MSAPKIAILVDGIRQVHADSHNGNHATLCGLDGDDPDDSVRQSPASRPERGEKITCPECRSIWETARLYRAADFPRGKAKA